MKSKRNKIIAAVVLVVAIVGVLLYINRAPLGKVEQIRTTQLEEKMENKENFVVVMTQVECVHCKKFLKTMESYLKNHELILYDVVLDYETNREEALLKLESIFPEFVGTPDIYYIERGEVKSNLNRELQKGDSLDDKAFDAWVKKYNIK